MIIRPSKINKISKKNTTIYFLNFSYLFFVRKNMNILSQANSFVISKISKFSREGVPN